MAGVRKLHQGDPPETKWRSSKRRWTTGIGVNSAVKRWNPKWASHIAAPSGTKVMANRQAIARKLPLRTPNCRLANAHPATETIGNSPSTKQKKMSRMAGREMRPSVNREKLSAFSTGSVIEAAFKNAPNTSSNTKAARSVLSANLPIDDRKWSRNRVRPGATAMIPTLS